MTLRQLRTNIHPKKQQLEDNFGNYNSIIDKYKVVQYANEKKTIDLKVNKGNSYTNSISNFNTFTIARAHDILYSSVQKQIILASSELNFKYCRFHNIFGDEMNVVDVDFNHNLSFNFTKPIEIIEFLVENKITPIIQLGFFPKEIASDSISAFTVYNINVGLDINFDLWKQLIKEFITTLITYFPSDYLSFKFDIWNEPEVKAFWPNSHEQFIELYSITYDTIKSIDSNLLVGGFGFANFDNELTQITSFVDPLLKLDKKPDFLSIHSYPLLLDLNTMTHPDDISTLSVKYVSDKLHYDLDKCRELKSTLNLKELHISEWNTSPIQ